MSINHRVGLVTINYNDADTTKKFVESIINFPSVQHIVVVDNASTDNSFEELRSIQSTKVDVVDTGKNGGYGYGNNVGVEFLNKHYKVDYILISNPDVKFNDEIINPICECLANDDNTLLAGIIMRDINGIAQTNSAWKILSPMRMVLNEGAIINRLLHMDRYMDIFKHNITSPVYVDCVAGSFFMIKNNPLFVSPLFDENMFLYCEESYLGLKIKNANMHEILLPNYSFVHEHGVSINKKYKSRTKQDKMIFQNMLYLMRNYMNCSDNMLHFAKFFFDICIAERFAFRKMKSLIESNGANR